MKRIDGAKTEEDRLRAEFERMTKDRDEWRAQCSEAEADRDEYKSQINEAWSAAQAELCKAIDMRKRAEATARKLAMAVEALNTGISEVETIGNALHNDGFVYANNAWRVVASFRATLAELEKADG